VVAVALVLLSVAVLALSANRRSDNRLLNRPVANLVVKPATESAKVEATDSPPDRSPAFGPTGQSKPDRRVITDRTSQATSDDGRATSSGRTVVAVDGPDGPVIVHTEGIATANTGGNEITGDGTITTGPATAIGNATDPADLETGPKSEAKSEKSDRSTEP